MASISEVIDPLTKIKLQLKEMLTIDHRTTRMWKNLVEFMQSACDSKIDSLKLFENDFDNKIESFNTYVDKLHSQQL